MQSKIDSAKRILESAYKLSNADQSTASIMFSGGKDSIVMAHLAKQTIGVSKAFCEASLLPYGTLDEIKVAAIRIGINPIYHQQHNPTTFARLHWMNQMPPVKWRPSMLDKVRHWVSMPRYAKAHHLNLQLYGRRKEENTIPEPIYKTKKHGDIVQCHPIHDWTKEEVWKYIKYNDLVYPSCYKDGSQHLRSWVTMAHQAYAKRNSIDDAFEIVYETASDYLTAAGTVDERVIRFLFR